VVIDEAQNLSDTALETVRLLTNFETPQAKLMQIVLAGQPQLSEKLMSPSLVQLRQRISTICRLEPLSNRDTKAYVEFRLAAAGYEGPSLFSEDALTLIFEDSQGIPRRINNLCFNALSLCCALKRKRVDGAMVAETVADQQLPSQMREAIPVPIEITAASINEEKHPTHRPRQFGTSAPALATILILCAFAVSGVSRYYKMRDVFPTQLQTKTQSAPSHLTTMNFKTEEIVAGSPRTESFEITVRARESLSDIAVQYLGSFDRELLHEIQLLNPDITDPDMIQPGQKIRLPDRSTLTAAEHITSSNGRNLP
jgi:hypothetical protein